MAVGGAHISVLQPGEGLPDVRIHAGKGDGLVIQARRLLDLETSGPLPPQDGGGADRLSEPGVQDVRPLEDEPFHVWPVVREDREGVAIVDQGVVIEQG
ncbi:hypothetical protein PG999_007066 [Apiospora kogelbergensis]|uniref:Uncharacterized protein n=1 Tax=Apiospora kogelbergensis TaxID=1337665 RepID=A0AAW0QX99_9PEZI